MTVVAIVYLCGLTIGGAVLALRMHLIHLAQMRQYYESIGNVHDLGSLGIALILDVWDFIQDNTKYVLAAIVISVVSLVVYVWALLKPARWTAHVMLITGIGFAWLAGFPPQKLSKLLSEDTYSIVRITVFAIGHVYLLTSAVQLLAGANNEDYFLDVVEEKQRAKEKQLKKAQALMEAVEAGSVEEAITAARSTPGWEESYGEAIMIEVQKARELVEAQRAKEASLMKEAITAERSRPGWEEFYEEAIKAECSRSDFKKFYSELSASDRRLFVDSCQRGAIARGTKDKSEVRKVVSDIWENWQLHKEVHETLNPT